MKVVFSVFVAAFLIGVFAASTATAQEADLVLLTSGGRLRGTVTEYLPGERVTIRLGNGELRTLTAAEVSEVRFGDSPAPAAPPVPPPVAPTEPTPLEVTPPPPLTSEFIELGPRGAAQFSPPPPATTWTEPRVFTDHASNVPWDLQRTDLRLTPASDFRWGARLALGGRSVLFEFWGDPRFGGELGGFAEFVVSRRFVVSFRLEGLVGLYSEASRSMPWGINETRQQISGTGSLDVRLLLGLHTHDESFVFRFGGEVGAELVAWATGRPGVQGIGAGVIEFATRWGDERRLEIFLSMAFGVSGFGRYVTYAAGFEDQQYSTTTARVLLGSSYAF